MNTTLKTTLHLTLTLLLTLLLWGLWTALPAHAQGPVIVGETGQVNVPGTIEGGNSITVTLSHTYNDPVIVVFINTFNGSQSVDVRVRNVTGNSFNLFKQEPTSGGHGDETVSYIVMEKGHYWLSGGLEVEAGTVDTNSVHHDVNAPGGVAVTFGTAFGATPAVLHSLNSYNNGDFMSTAARSVSASGFTVQQEAAGSGSSSTTETIGWIAFTTGSGSHNGQAFEIGRASDGASDGVQNGTPHVITFSSFTAAPDVVVKGNSNNVYEGYWAQGAGTFNATTQSVWAEEDEVGDTERSHGDETFAWAAFAPNTLLYQAGCLVEADGDNVPDYGSDDASALRLAVTNAGNGDTLKVAGICAGVATQGSTDQVLYLDKDLTVTGGYTYTNWTSADPSQNPTTLDAESAGRVVRIPAGHTVTLKNLALSNGNVTGNGAGLLVASSALTVENSWFSDNTASSNGGGLRAEGTAVVTIRDSMFTDNEADDGGGINNNEATVTLKNSTLYSNRATGGGGGGILNFGGDLAVLNSTISTHRGSGIYNSGNGAGLVMSYTTVISNDVAGIEQFTGGTVSAALFNSLIANNTVQDCWNRSGGTNLDVSGGYNLDSDGSCVTDGVDNNITSATPQVSVIQNNGGPATGSGYTPWTHSLLSGSLARDKTPTGVNGCNTTITTDQRGKTRPFNSACDIGAYEDNGESCFVEANGDWLTDYISSDASALRDAIADANSGDTLKVAGTCAGVASNQVVYINKNLTVTGGYTTTNWLAAPDSDTHPTVLDAEDSGRVVYVTNNANLVLSHLTLCNGDPGGSINPGGAVFLDSNTTTAISNSRIEDSQTNFLGGGIYNNGDLTLANSTVSGNRSVSYDGGGIYNNDAITVTASAFLSNTAPGNGGGLFSAGTMTFSGNTFSGNQALSYDGGGLHNGGAMSGYNNTFSGNSAGDQGGGLYSVSSATGNQVSYSTFSGNSAVTGGGGVYGDSGLQLYGVIVANSPAGGDCASVNAVSDAVQDGGYNLIEDGSCLTAGTSLSGDPLLDPLADNGGQTQTHALQEGSPALLQIPAGSCAPATDQRGTSRPQFSLCDMGAYENSTNFPPIAVDDVYPATEEIALTVVAPGVLDNDIEHNSQSMSVTLQSGVSHGTLSLNSNGSFVYTPTLNFNGSDSFTYIVSDGSQSDTGQVTLNVIAINDPPVATDDNYTAGENVSLTGNVINDDTGSGSDSDPDGDTLTANLATNVITGDLTLNGDGSFTYLPPLDWTGSVTFTYWLTDSDGAATFHSLDFDGVNDYLATASLNNGNATTFEAWVRPDEIHTAVQQIYNGGGPPKMVIEINGSGGGGTWEGRVYDGSGTVGQIFGPAAVPGQWTHVAYVYDYGSNRAELFINGVSAGTATAPSAITHSSSRTLGAISTGNVEFLKGRLAEVRLWNTARTEAQIQANMNQAVDPGDSDLLAYYRMADNGYGSSTAVDSANGYNATLINMDPTTAWITPGASDVATVTITVNPARCWVERTGDQYADYGSWDGSAVQTAIDQAGAGDTLKISGTCAGVQTVNAETQVAYVSKSLAISGGYTYTNWLAAPNPDLYPTVLDAEQNGRVLFSGKSTNAVTLSGLTFQNGNDQEGGGLSVRGAFTFTDCIIQYNTSSGNPVLGGGGIFAATGSQIYIEGTTIAHNQSSKPGGGAYFRGSDVTIVDSSVYDNDTDADGGGLFFYGGNGRISNTVIYSNTTVNYGGGMQLADSSEVRVTNSTISYNNANIGGGISDVSSSLSSLTLSHVTLYGNVASTNGMAISNGSTGNSLHIEASILAGAGDDCSGNPFYSDNYNISDDTSCNLSGMQDQPGTDPMLADLADYSGETWTHALLPGSPAIDVISASSCTLSEDQRGINRPVNSKCDIGAFESQGFRLTIVGGNNQSAAVNTTFAIPLQVTYSGKDPGLSAVEGQEVAFTAPASGASLSPRQPITTTDDSGTASVTANANGTAGTYQVTATADYVNTPVIFTLTNNGAPIATDDSYTTPEDTPVSGNVISDDTGNSSDSDADNDPLTVTLQADVGNGTLTLNSDGSFVYTPTLNYNGTDDFIYILSDGVLTDTAQVTLTVIPANDPPVATADSYTTPEDTPVSGNVISDDTGNGSDGDVDNDPLTAALQIGVSSGTLTLNADGSFVYTPTLNFSGSDGFSYILSDGVLTDTAQVTLTVTPVNDAPVATDDSYTTAEDTPVSGNVISDDTGSGSDSDVDNDSLTVTLQTDVSSGTLTLNADGSFVYTPTLNFNGADGFTYILSDGVLTNTAQVSITVTGAGSDTTPPTLPALISPADGSVITTTQTPAFDWTDATDAQSGVISYTLLITGSSGTQQIPTTESGYTPSSNLAAGVYTWTVQAHDGAGNASGYVSPPFTFTLAVESGTSVYLPIVIKGN